MPSSAMLYAVCRRLDYHKVVSCFSRAGVIRATLAADVDPAGLSMLIVVHPLLESLGTVGGPLHARIMSKTATADVHHAALSMLLAV